MSAGVAQGSALGPDLWNALYDGILQMRLPPWAKLVGFADDIAAAVRARNGIQAQQRVSMVTGLVGDWLKSHGLVLAASKTEVVVLSRQRHFSPKLRMQISDEFIEAQDVVRYFGEVLNRELTHWPHIRTVADKAAKVAASLSRLMTNISQTKSSKRRILMSVAQSILLYAAEIWAATIKVAKCRRSIASVHRSCALRVVCAWVF